MEAILNRFVVISGCSSGGKSSLIRELAARGHSVVEEPGRRIVGEELERNGNALPWIDGVAFARRAIAMALADRQAALNQPGWVFFDRGLVDAAAALEHRTGEPVLEKIARPNRYHLRVFLTPPWPEIFASDSERRHGLDAAIAEYERLLMAYAALDYEILILPKMSILKRARLVLATLET